MEKIIQCALVKCETMKNQLVYRYEADFVPFQFFSFLEIVNVSERFIYAYPRLVRLCSHRLQIMLEIYMRGYKRAIAQIANVEMDM